MGNILKKVPTPVGFPMLPTVFPIMIQTFTKGLPTFPTFRPPTAPRPPGTQVGYMRKQIDKPLGVPRFSMVVLLYSNFH